MSDYTIITKVKQGQQARIKVSNEYKDILPPYKLIGRNGINMKHGIKVDGIDIAPILQNLKTASTWLIWELEQKRNPFNNEAVYIPTTETEKSRVKAGYKELREVGLVKRIRRGTYILNPKAFIPHPTEEYVTVKNIWDSKL